MVKLLIQYHAYVDARNNYGNTGLMVACKNNHLDIVMHLHQQSANIYLKNTHGDTCLTLACNEGIYTHSLTHSLTYLLTHLLTHSLTHQVTLKSLDICSPIVSMSTSAIITATAPSVLLVTVDIFH